MNGAIIPHTPIAVDVWSIRKTAASKCRLFFLSHAHTDHTMGLTSSWKEHKIYTSEITKKLVAHKLGVRSELLIGLPVDQPVEISMDEVGKEKLVVTLIDANHCPGAVVFLFEGYFGTILYTGDFRYYKSLTGHPVLKDKTIDKLYLDNTYCDPLCMFPSRDVAMAKVLDIVQDHLNRDFHIVIGLNSLGKEELLVEIGVRHQTWVGVNPKRMALLKLLDLPDVFTCDVESTRIRVVMPRQITKYNLQAWNENHPTIAILPTSLFEGDVNVYQYMSNVFVVPLSDHSSYDELLSFVSEVKPKEIIPIVLKHKSSAPESSNSRVNMSVFSSYLNKEPLSSVIIPETVLQFMGSDATKSKSNKRVNTQMTNTRMYKRRKCSGVVFDEEEEDVREGQSSPSPHVEKEATGIPDRFETHKMLKHHDKHDSLIAMLNGVQETTSLHVEKESTGTSEILEIEGPSDGGHQQEPKVVTNIFQGTLSLDEQEPRATPQKRFQTLSFHGEKEPTVQLEEFEVEKLRSHKERDQEPNVARKRFRETLSLESEEEEQLFASKRFDIQRTLSCKDEKEHQATVVTKRNRTKGTLDQYLCITKRENSVQKNIPSQSSRHETCNPTKIETNSVVVKSEDFSNCNMDINIDHKDSSDPVEHTNNVGDFCAGRKIFKKGKNYLSKDITPQNLQNTSTKEQSLPSQNYQSPTTQQEHKIRKECDLTNCSSMFSWLSNSFTDASCSGGQKATQTPNADKQRLCANTSGLQELDVKQETVTISSDSDDDSSSGFNWFTTFKFG